MPDMPADVPPLAHEKYNPFWVAIAMQMVIEVAETMRDFPGPFTRDVIEDIDRLYTAMPDDARVCLMYALLKRGCEQTSP